MDLKRQASAPLYEAIEKFRKKRIVPFDVPGHKRGRGNPELVDLLGERCVGIDVNSMKPLDNLCHPVSVIKEAEELTADAFGAEHAFFMGGSFTQDWRFVKYNEKFADFQKNPADNQQQKAFFNG